MTVFLEAEITGETETKAFGGAFAECVKPKDLILLVGDLGAGKTTFVSGAVSRLCPGEEATSPTFTLVHRYRGLNFDVLHADLWRLDNEKEITDLSIWEELEEGAAAFVEWGDKAGELLGVPDYLISFGEQKPGSRLVRIFFPDQGKDPNEAFFLYGSATAEVDISDVSAEENSGITRPLKAAFCKNGISVKERRTQTV